MNVLFLCGYFEPQYQKKIAEKTKTWIENAANTFQQRMIRGLKAQDISLSVVSLPFIGAWPTAYTDRVFRGFEPGKEKSCSDIKYVPFHNLWGFRNISRARAAKKEAAAFLKRSGSGKKAIIVYAAHTPFLEAAVWAKKKDPELHICLVVPDLPQYMNLSKAPHPVYDFFKKIDICRFETLCREVESFMLLTEPMAEKLQVGNRPYIVVEGIADSVEIPERTKPRGKTVAYAGKLQESFGVKRLLEAFALIEDPEARLEICGGGELRSFVEEMCRRDSRIHYHGLVSAEESRRIMQEADVLVNPRQNDEEYTKYSFPSKNIEYLLTGNAVVAYMLDGMPVAYKQFLFLPEDETERGLANEIETAWEPKSLNCKTLVAKEYIQRKLLFSKVAKAIVDLMT